MQYKRLLLLIITILILVSFNSLQSLVLGAQSSEKIKGSASKTLSVLSEPQEAELKSYASPEERLSDMSVVFEDDYSSLYVDPLTAQFAVKKKSSGDLYFSSPYDLSSSNASQDIQELMASAIHIVYYDSEKNQKEMNSFSDAASKGQITVYSIEKGFAAQIIMGVKETRILLPSAIPANSMENKILPNLSDDDLWLVKKFYKRNDLDDYDTKDDYRAELMKQYPGIQKGPVYILRELGEQDQKEVIKALKTSGYTFEQMEADLKEVGLTVQHENAEYFEMRLECVLENGELAVRIPTETIEYDKKSFSLQKISLLEFFGSAKQKTSGYIFIPDGSGALISFNRGELAGGSVINAPVYGNDAAKSFSASSEDRKAMRMPVFGMKNETGSYFCIIEAGDAAAEISCVSGAAEHPYSTVWASFHYNAEDTYHHTTGGEEFEWTQVDNNPLQGFMQLRFMFLEQEASDYSAMAATYRQYLINKGQLNNTALYKTMPLYIGTIGAVKTQNKILLFPVKSLTALTEFDESEEIARELREAGAENLNLRLLGWANGGMEATAANKADILKVLGGNNGLKKLNEYAAENNIGLFPDIDITSCKYESMFDGFSRSRDSAKMLNGSYALTYRVDIGTNQKDKSTTAIALSPEKMKSFFNQFLKSYKVRSQGVSLGSVGYDLHSDYSEKNPLNRQQAMTVSQDILETAKEKYSVMTESGNFYTLKNVDHILNIANGSNSYIHSIATVPFMQMVLHGTNKSYASQPINLSSDKNWALLKAVENGEGLYFVVAMKNSYNIA